MGLSKINLYAFGIETPIFSFGMVMSCTIPESNIEEKTNLSK